MFVRHRLFKKCLSVLETITGCRLSNYESLLDRTRCEAILRIKESAILSGVKIIVNVPIETASIRKQINSRYWVGSFEVVAYTTAPQFCATVS
ncbi:MAG: hypothetical protein ACI9JR_002130 [Gammaproteobacteria bacterium]|jgi:uncharacterized protein YbjQ (UPF0145 family)